MKKFLILSTGYLKNTINNNIVKMTIKLFQEEKKQLTFTRFASLPTVTLRFLKSY